MLQERARVLSPQKLKLGRVGRPRRAGAEQASGRRRHYEAAVMLALGSISRRLLGWGDPAP